MISSDAERRRATSVAAFLLPALTTWLPSGYGWGTALLIGLALWTAPAWARAPGMTRETRWLLLCFSLMGLAWLVGGDWGKGWSILNRPLRYVGAVLCLLYAVRYPPSPRALLAGIAFGAAAGGLRALYDVHIAGLERAWAYPSETANAIQIGNLCGLFGLMCWAVLLVYWGRWSWPQRLLAVACTALGVLGSLLSQTRGGWLALAQCLVLLALLMARRVAPRRLFQGGVVLALAVAPLAWQMSHDISQRLQWAYEEVQTYGERGKADNSVGQRLEHGRLAWRLGLEKPLTGWGEGGYQAEKARRVQQGQADPYVLQFGHPHNEFLDQFAKRGLPGVAILLFFYGIPLWLLWPRPATVLRRDGTADRVALSLCFVGILLPLGYIGFGLTQTFLAHHNGNMVYLNLVLLIFAALQARLASRESGAHPGPEKDKAAETAALRV